MISIIIPCYNAAEYLENILLDVRAQTYTDWELILVSNGENQISQLDIINKYVLKDKRIRLIETKQVGVSNARNLGINSANGCWLCFVDADDRLEKEHLQYFVDAITPDSEIIEGGFIQISINGNKSYYILKEQNIKLQNIVGTEYYIQIANQVGNAPWHTLFNTSFLKKNNILFDTRFTMNEDRIFKMKAFLSAKNIQFIPKTGYVYIASSGSAMSRYHKNIEDSWNVFLDLKDEIKRKSNINEMQIKHERIEIQYYLIWQYIWNMFKKGCSLSFLKKVRRIKSFLQNREFIESCKVHDWSSENFYYKLFYICVLLKSPFLVGCLFASQHYIKKILNMLVRL